MKYEIEFDNNMVEKIAEEFRFWHEWSITNRESGDYPRAALDVGRFDMLRTVVHTITGVDTSTRIMWDDEGYPEIRTARIGHQYFVHNGVFNERKLYDALWELAHPGRTRERRNRNGKGKGSVPR